MKPPSIILPEPAFALRIDIHPGRMLLIVGPRAIRFYMTRLVASLAFDQPLRLLEAGASLDPSLLRQLAVGRAGLLQRIERSRAPSSRRLLFLLEAAEPRPAPLFIVDFLGPFYDPAILLSERKWLLEGCLQQLRRLARSGGGVVSLCPPPKSLSSARSLFRLVEKRAPGLFSVEIILPSRELKKLLTRQPSDY